MNARDVQSARVLLERIANDLESAPDKGQAAAIATGKTESTAAYELGHLTAASTEAVHAIRTVINHYLKPPKAKR